MGYLIIYMQMNTFTYIQYQNIVSDVIYLIFASLISWLWRHKQTKMVPSITAVLDMKKQKNILFLNRFSYVLHQSTHLKRLFIF